MVRILKDLDTDITGRHVLVVEDIIDTGLTLSWLVSNLASRGPASVEICTLLRKPEAQQMTVDVKYVGYDIPNEFVVGYGLDYDEKYRNLRSIGTLAPHVLLIFGGWDSPRRFRGTMVRDGAVSTQREPAGSVGFDVYRRKSRSSSDLAGGRGVDPGTWT